MASETWRHLSLGEVVTLQRGYDLPHKARKHGTVPIISSSGRIDTHNEARVAGPGVVTGRYGTIGEVFFISEDFWPLNTTLFVKDFKGNNPLFISFLLRTIDYQSYSGKSGVPGVNRNDLHEISVSLPPLPEQRAIATALSDVDALLTSLDKLIAKKRDIKQATMQQLLTSKTRLPGFNGHGSAKLGDFFELNPTKTRLNDTDLVTFIRMEDISESGRIINQHCMPLSSIKKGFTFFERNDVLVAKITPCFENGKGACLDTLKTKSGFGSTEFHVLRAKKNAIPRYVFYQTQTVEFRQRLEAEMIGTAGQKRVPAQAIINYSLPVLHLIDEQAAIAAILSDMDAEIAALEQRRDKTRALKQGMMQELLTGKTRLV